MFKQKGNFQKALQELSKDTNNVVSQVIDKQNENDGILKGVVYTLKDNYATKEYETKASSKTLENFKPLYNSSVYQRLVDQGASMVAKVHCDEFGLGGTGTFSAYGIIKNPLDSTRLAGGSSSGSAASMFYDIGFSIGSDTGDSVRLPASWIGKVGFKPSYGAISRYGLFTYASSLDTVAYFSHNVSDAIVLSKVLYGKDKKDMSSVEVSLEKTQETKPKKIAYFNCFNELSKEVAQSFKNLIKFLESQGIEMVKIEIDYQMMNNIKYVYDIISYSEAFSNLSNIKGLHFGKTFDKDDFDSWKELCLKNRSTFFGDMVQRRLLLGSIFLDENNIDQTFFKAKRLRYSIYKYLSKIFEENEVLIYPAYKDIAPKFDEQNEQNYMDFILSSSNLVGNPSITIPFGTKDNMPFGININTNLYEDAKLLSYSLYFEKILKGQKHE
ncbi:amidase family protein [Mycoplasmopsis pulmonis]|nr:amidase family protein [Mycoplasmopsis pulmonis]MDZ7293166.1 amidase family protein [Mycoplasmopsis pulmonis]VEU67963.1 aspartyl/glutamyl-tRNA(Asn/Gln) amidotransferase subunit A [Mycoplasmopsis pulmonis]